MKFIGGFGASDSLECFLVVSDLVSCCWCIIELNGRHVSLPVESCTATVLQQLVKCQPLYCTLVAYYFTSLVLPWWNRPVVILIFCVVSFNYIICWYFLLAFTKCVSRATGNICFEIFAVCMKSWSTELLTSLFWRPVCVFILLDDLCMCAFLSDTCTINGIGWVVQ